MAERSLPFDYTELDPREYEAAIWAAMQARLTRDGVAVGIDGELQVVATDPVTLGVSVSTGSAFVRGYFYVNDEAKNLSLEAADPANPRIDRVVLRLNLEPDERNVLAFVKTGTPAVSPVPPSLTRAAYIYELSLAQIYVAAGATFVNQANITDERGDMQACGWSVHPAALDMETAAIMLQS